MQIHAHASAQPQRSRMQEAVAPVNARAARPLAVSARPKWFGAGSALCAEPALSTEEQACFPAHSFFRNTKNPMHIKALASLGQVTGSSKPMQALRGSAKPNTRGRAATSFARGGGFGLLAGGGVTQRTMRAGRVPQSALPNPSIERTNNGGSQLRAFASAQPPLFASHLKR